MSKEAILPRLQDDTIRYFQAFWQCDTCGRIFWQGAHYDRMLQRIGRLTGGSGAH